MSTFAVFLKKEMIEHFKNYKLFILSAVMLLLGIMSPALAKFTPELLSSIDVGFDFDIPEPTILDSYVQFFGNIIQMGFITVLLVFSNNITHELSKGTAAMMFSKGLSRNAFILSKLCVMLLLWTASYLLSVLSCFGYTVFLFDKIPLQHMFLSMFCLWLLFVFAITLHVMASCLFDGFGSLLLTAGVVVALLIAGIIPAVKEVSPLTLGSYNVELLSGARGLSDVLIPIITASVAAIVFVACALAALRKKQL